MEDLKNPERQNIALALIVFGLGIIVALVPFVIKAVAVYQFYFGYFGIMMIAFGIGFSIFYYRRFKQFVRFSEEQDDALIWQYGEKQYTDFISELNKIQQQSSKKRAWSILAIVLVASVILFMLLSAEMKWMSFLFFIFFGGLSFILTYIFPKSFKYKAMIRPYVTIIHGDSAYIMGRFHKWTKAQAKIKNYDNGEKMYKVVAINYEAHTRNGKLFQEWTAVIPEPENQEMMADAKKWVNRINKKSRDYEKAKKEKKPYTEKLFDRIMGRTK
ncbi:MAG: threonine/serine exporter family protein [Acetobacterium sp.]